VFRCAKAHSESIIAGIFYVVESVAMPPCEASIMQMARLESMRMSAS
jgi:hypothetical protein